MKIFITAGCFQFILKEHYVSETHLFRPQVKRFEEAITVGFVRNGYALHSEIENISS
jgi:hypothetical protein